MCEGGNLSQANTWCAAAWQVSAVPNVFPHEWQPEPQYHSIPFPSLIHLTPHATSMPWASRHARAIFVAGSFSNLTGLRSQDRIIPRLRTALREACEAASPDCLFYAPGAKSFHVSEMRQGSGFGVSENVYLRLARLYWDSVFCLQPSGDDISRKGIVDSLLLGCIPVLFHPGQRYIWPWHWGAWVRQATVLISYRAILEGQVNVIKVLKRIPASLIERMQATIAANAHRMQYSALDTRLLGATAPDVDAFDIAVHGAARLAADSSNAAAGHERQHAFELGHRGGYCAFTEREGDCSTDDRGFWIVETLHACAARCKTCAGCMYISFNGRTRECSWFRSCDLVNLLERDGGGDFITVHVKQVAIASDQLGPSVNRTG